MDTLYYLMGFITLGTVVHGIFDGNMTLQNIHGHLPDDAARSEIHCISSLTKAENIKFGRTINTGQGKTPPRKSLQFIQTNPFTSRSLWMPPADGTKRFGAYHCNIVINRIPTTRIVTLKLPPEKLTEIQAAEPYKIVNKGEDVILTMVKKKTLDAKLAIKWRHNGNEEITVWENQLVVTISKVDVGDAGIYECYYSGRRSEGVHGLMRLIVRACPNGKYGTSCENDCPVCYNGGVCHDVWGVCICPAGFTGQLCEKACGGNHFGSDCTKVCSQSSNASNANDGCGTHLFCKPDPYGCSCAPGFKGSKCAEACDPGSYGANCAQICHCKRGKTACNRITGACDGGCLPGWTGDSCEIPTAVKSNQTTACGLGFYGINCEQTCHCKNGGDACNRSTGACDGGCLPGWIGDSCEIHEITNREASPDYGMAHDIDSSEVGSLCPVNKYGPPECKETCHCLKNSACDFNTGNCSLGCAPRWTGESCSKCAEGYFGEHCEHTCHCSGGPKNCEEEGFCSSGCEAGWTGFTCQQPCNPGRFGPNCIFSCHCKDGIGACNQTTGICNGDCEAGYMNATCQTKCLPTNFGVNCAETCTCENSGRCDRIDGHCECEGRWQGVTCNESIPQIVAVLNQDVNFGQDVYVSCTVDAIPEPTINISLSKDPHKLEHNKSRKRKLESGNQYEAVVKFSPEEIGTIDLNCSARNKYGFDTKIFSVFVIIPPMLKDPPEILEVTEFSVKIGWRPWEYGRDVGGKDSDRVDYKVLYREKDSRIWKNDTKWEPELSYTITKLEPDTEYEFAVKCRRPQRGGEGKPSPIVSQRTLCGVPGTNSIVQYFMAEEINTTSVDLSWKPPLKSELKCSINGYKLRYSMVADPDAQHYTESFKYRDIPQDQVHIVVDGLTPNSAYIFHLFVETSQGLADRYAQLEITTLEGVPGPVLNVNYKMLTPDVLVITWDESEIKNGKITGYSVTSKLLDKSQCGADGITSSPGDTLTHPTEKIDFTPEKSIQVKGLFPYSLYLITVQASTSAGLGEPETFTLTTLETEPSGSPQNVHATFVGKRELHFKWDPVNCRETNGKVLNYEYGLRILKTSSRSKRFSRSTDSDWVVPPTTTKDLEVEIKELTPFMQYGFMVRAHTGVGPGPYSDILKQMTAEDVPPALILSVLDAGENQIKLQWTIPDPPLGRIKQYWLQYSTVKMPSHLVNVTVDVAEDNVESVFEYTVDNLKPFTQYSVQVRGASSAGWGNWSEELIVQTKHGLPGPPINLHLLSSTDTSLKVSWDPPEELNAFYITQYKVSYGIIKEDEFSISLAEVIVENTTLSTVLTNLMPGSNYSVQVQAETLAGFGPAIVAVYQTENGNISEPPSLTISKTLGSTVVVSFMPTNSSRVQKYQVIVEKSSNSDGIDEEMLTSYENAEKLNLPYYVTAEIDAKDLPWGHVCHFLVGDGNNISRYYNAPLKSDTLYNIRVRLVTTDGVAIKSTLSDPVSYRKESPTFKMWGIYWLYLLLLFMFIIIVIISLVAGSMFLANRRKAKKHNGSHAAAPFLSSETGAWSVVYRVPEMEPSDGTLVCSERPVSILGAEILNTYRKTQNHKSTSSYIISVDDLADYVETKMGHPVHNFAEEFQKLPAGQTAEWTVAKKAENVKKNRYGNILPYDNNRVILKPSLGIKSDYINASYIKGYNMSKEYIVTQGPMENTISEFWQMVWQENASVIVMVTALLENGKRKCAKYWPDDSSVFGDLSILLIYTEPFVDFILRTFLLTKLSTDKTRRVLHYQYLDWPNSPLPFNTSSLLHMQQRIRMQSLNNHGPFIIHCSAGVGRAGTFIAVDTARQQAEETKKVDIYSIVKQLRLQRNNMVQTLEQYIFIYETILEATQCGNTAVSTDELPSYIRELCRLKSGTDRSKLEHQFLTLSKMKKKMDTALCAEALHESNIFKNRDPLIVPTDTARIKLQNHRMADEEELQTDYINAVCVNGYRQRTMFLVTHMPLEETVIDFWQMIYDYNSSLIIMLDSTFPITDSPSSAFGQYWPEGGCCLYGPFEVQIVTFEDQRTFRVRVMKLINNLVPNEEPHRVIQLQFMEWPAGDTVPTSAPPVLDLLNHMELWYRKTKGGPITVHCWDGATKSGLFCVASYITDQLRCEHMVDVFHAVKRIRSNREEFIPNVEQYKFCYEIASELTESLANYSNFRWSSY